LAEDFKVSRSTIREALRGLLEVGLIRTVPGAGGGSFVEYFNHHTLSELVFERLNNTLELGSVSYEEVAGFRNLLEVPSARLAAANRTNEHLLELRNVIDQEKNTTANDPEVEHYNARFHGILAEASGNRVLVAFVNAMHRVAHPLRFIDTTEEVGRQAVRHHIAIAAAVEAQDQERAAVAMEEHLAYLRQHVPSESSLQTKRLA
jgi:DNA-binding FadR family transcriptional regulator